jgi:hypothetical protein
MFDRRWFEEESGTFPHTYDENVCNASVKDSILPLLPTAFAAVSPKDMWNSLKALKYVDGRPIADAFVRAALCTSGWPDA